MMGFTFLPEPEKKGKVLFLHGWCSDGSYKSMSIGWMGYEVETPQLSDWAFNVALNTAQEACEKFNPDVIVGSSRGAAIAMNLETNKPLVLIAPAWKRFGVANTVRNPHSVVLHSPKDSVVPYEDSVTLCANSPGLILFAAGENHRMNDHEAQQALSEALKHCCGSFHMTQQPK